jgi:hypothetical protein
MALMVRLLALLLSATLAACGPAAPYAVVRGVPSLMSTETRDVRFSETGFRAVIVARCGRAVIENWCAPSVPECRPDPITVRREEVLCPADLQVIGSEVRIRSPWGVVYPGITDSAGVATVGIDWATSGIDPLAAESRELLRSGWTLNAGVGDEGTPITLAEAEVETILTLIGEATDTQYTAGAANERAALTAEFVDVAPMAAGGWVTLTLSVRNDGPDPAYRTIAKLRSSIDALHGLQFSFGRIDAGQTKVRSRQVVVPADVDDRSPLVVAAVSYFNGESVSTQKRYTVIDDPTQIAKSEQGLVLQCKLAAAEVAPGERVRIQCDVRNTAAVAARDLRFSVAVDGVTAPNVGPKELAAGDQVSVELVGAAPAEARQGASLLVVVGVEAPGLTRAEKTLSVGVASFTGMCQQGKLTREQYRAKRKRLEAALAADALTQKEFDDYDAELLGCLE